VSELASDYRLPTGVVPRHYQIRLEPDLTAHTFVGNVNIEVEVDSTTTQMVLNAIELEIGSATVESADRSQEASVSYDSDRERLVLDLATPVEPGPAVVSITFTGTLNDKLRGFYRSTFTDADGNERTIATTQFESTNARRAFPCWDEPIFKATFEVDLVVEGGLFAVSSGPELSREPVEEGRVKITFDRTMVMSTYLLAFVVGPLEATDPIDVDGVALRIVHPIGKEHLTPYALEAAAFSLRHFTDYFGIPYPDNKLDLVAVPDFAFGAMENQGCATFREILLLIDPETSTQPERQRAVDVIAHEISHMWFGNLVTMGWWNGIWLKEAFATFCETHACAAYRPEWEPWTNFGLARSAAFDVDALDNTRPIEFEVVSPADAEAMYDVLTYEKGGAVVRMLERYLSEDAFRGGIRSYLADHSFSNTETTDLWDSIEAATGAPVRRVMDSWIFQGGYPVVSVSRIGDTRISIEQQPFAFSSGGAPTEWEVPIVLTVYEGNSTRRQAVLLSQPSTEVEVGPFDWVVANAQGSGFYRVRYAGELNDRIVAAHASLEPVERYGLLDDAWAAVVAGHRDLDSVLSLVEALTVDETDLSVWKRIAGVIDAIDHHLLGDMEASFASRVITLARPALDRLVALPESTAMIQQMRAVVFRVLGLAGEERSVANAGSILDSESPEPEHLAAALTIVASVGGTEEFGRYVSAYASAPTPQDERRYLFALAEFGGEAECDALMAMIDNGQVRTQDAAFVLGHGLANKSTGPRVWRHIAATWDDLGERLPSNSIPRMVSGVTALADPDLAVSVRAFFDDHQLPQAGKTLAQHLERLDVNVGLRSRIRAQIS